MGALPTRVWLAADPEPVAFRCGCSHGRIEDALRGRGRDEVEAVARVPKRGGPNALAFSRRWPLRCG